MVFRVHRLNLVQCGFPTADPLAGEIRRGVALKVQLSLKPRPSLHHSLGHKEPLLTSGEPKAFEKI